MSSTTLTLATTRLARLSEAHDDYLATRIARHRDRAKQALKLARIAARHGNHALAAGLLDEACAYRAMANGLAEQQSDTTTGEQP